MKIISKVRRYYRECYTMGHYPSRQAIKKKGQKIYAYYGFIGDGNYGDELVFEATKKLFYPSLLIPLKRLMPLELLYLKQEKYAFSGIVIGGGTVIGSFWEGEIFAKLQDRENLPIFIHGSGVYNKIKDADLWKKTVFQRNFFGGVRGLSSQNHLAKIEQYVKVIGDAALLMFDQQLWEKLEKTKNNRILINFGTHYPFEGDSHSRTILRDFIEFLLQKKYEVAFLPMHSIDHDLGKKLSDTYPQIQVYDVPKNYPTVVNIFEQYDYAIGERLHFMILAVLLKTPFLSIKYASKHEDFLNELNLSEYGLNPRELSLENLKLAFDKLDNFQWKGTEKKLQSLKERQIAEYTEFMNSIAFIQKE
ncbi:MAG: polysaccharide pyruvyl transferase family protein [Bacteroidota bacterium]